MTKIHLDTDLGGDIDDICALAMLLRWPGVDITGITVVGDTEGQRTGYVRYVLGLEGRDDIPVATGAETTGGFYRYELTLPREDRYWPERTAPSPNPKEEALDLLKASIDDGATIIGIGPFTNLRLLDEQHPGILSSAPLFLMGGFVYPPRPGYPNWKNEFDFNVQVDVKSARRVFENSTPTLVTLASTAETALRRSHIDRLRAAGPLGQLIARQAEAFAEDEKMEAVYGKTCEHVPPDIINFLHDPLASAIAVGWNEGIEITQVPLFIEEVDGWLHERIPEPVEPDRSGHFTVRSRSDASTGTTEDAARAKPFNVVIRVDGPRFSEFWLDQVTAS